MAGEPNEGYGSLFRQHEKKNPNSPDFTGSFKLNGTVYRLSGWVREGRASGRKYLNLKIEPADGAPGTGGTPRGRNLPL